MITFACDDVAEGVSEVQFCLGEHSFAIGGFEIRRCDFGFQKWMLVGVQRKDLQLVPFLQQSGGQAVHGHATAVHGGPGWFVTDLKDAQWGRHGAEVTRS